jgi:competence protein ComEC
LTEASQAGSELAAIAGKRKIPVKSLGDLWGQHTIDGCELQVIHPSPDYPANTWDRRSLNNVSMVLHIVHGGTSLVLPGDIDQTVEAMLFQDRTPPPQLLLVSPHHGSAHSNPAWLFDALRPQAVIFSCGYDNLFGLPSPAVLAECKRRDIPFFRTDFVGAIRAVSDGIQWTIGAVKDRRN